MSGIAHIWHPGCTLTLFPHFDRGLQMVDQRGNRSALFSKSADRRGAIANVSALTATLELPSPRVAAKFSAMFAFRDLPVDPRTISAMAVEFHLGVVSAGNFAAGMVDPSGPRPLSMLTPLDLPGDPRNTLRLVGAVDEMELVHGADGGFISISGRDMRGVLLDSPILPATASALDLEQPIDKVVQQLIDTHPVLKQPGTRIKVVVYTGDWPNERVPSPADKDGLTRVASGAKGKKGSPKGSVPASNLNYWDLITQYCFLVGAIPTFRGRQLFLRPSWTLFQRTQAGQPGQPPTPFEGGSPRIVDGSPLRTRRMVYGHNILELKTSRKLAGRKAQPVEVVCLNTSSTARGASKLLRAVWPKGGVPNQGAAGENAPMRVPVTGITDIARLEQIARSVFEEVMRGEMKLQVATKDLTSFAGPTTDADLLRLEPGDAVEVLMAASVLDRLDTTVNEAINDASLPFEAAVSAVAGRIGSEPLARVLVATARSQLSLNPTFYVANVVYNFDRDDGLKVQFDATTYVEPNVEQGVGAPAATADSVIKNVRTKLAQAKQQSESWIPQLYTAAVLTGDTNGGEVSKLLAAATLRRFKQDFGGGQ